jgi:hypothetical protein
LSASVLPWHVGRETAGYPLDSAERALADLKEGRFGGAAVPVPWARQMPYSLSVVLWATTLMLTPC